MSVKQIQHLIAALTLVLSATAWSQSMTDTYTKPAGWKTWCIGRFLIDLPPTAKYAGGSSKYDYRSIETSKDPYAVFKQRIDSVEQQLRAQKHKSEPSMIKNVVNFDNEEGRGFFYFANKGYTDDLKSEGYIWKRVGFVFKSIASYDRLSIASDRMRTLAQTLTYRRSEEIPQGPGFCIDKGFISDDGEKYESADAGFVLSDKPDVSINLSTLTKKPGPSLLERQGGAMNMLGTLISKVHKLREGDRTTAGLAGQESLIRAPNAGGHPAHLFVWETQGQSRSAYPYIELELQTGRADKNGDEGPASLTDKQAIELFDAIVNSIRLRPTGPAKTSDASSPDAPASPHLPLGTRITSAANCPQSGMWECGPDAPGVTQKRRFIEAGQPMPYGYARTSKPGLPGLLGTKEDTPVEIIWTLAAYAQYMP